MIAGRGGRKGFDKEPAGPRRRRSTLDVLNALFAQQDVELFHSDLLTAYVGIPTSAGGVINAPVGSVRSNHFVQEVYFRATGKGLKERDLDDFNRSSGSAAGLRRAAASSSMFGSAEVQATSTMTLVETTALSSR